MATGFTQEIPTSVHTFQTGESYTVPADRYAIIRVALYNQAYIQLNGANVLQALAFVAEDFVLTGTFKVPASTLVETVNNGGTARGSIELYKTPDATD